MKKYMVASIVVALVACMGTSALADMTPRTETDVIDNWGLLGLDAAPIVEGLPLTYTHDLNQEVRYDIGEYVSEADLTLDFTNMGADGYTETHWVWTGWFRGEWVTEYHGVPEWEEWVTVAFLEDGTVVALGEIDEDSDVQTIMDLGVDIINDDGMLDVQVSVANIGSGLGTISLDSSTLDATVVPVPGAVLLGILGLSAAGIKLRKRA